METAASATMLPESPRDEHPEIAEDEHALIERAKTQGEAMALLYRTYEPLVSRYVFRRVCNRADAEDIISDVFLAMVRALPRYQSTKAPFAVWLYRIATNRIHWHLRKQLVRKWLGLGHVPPDARPASHDDAEAVRAAMAKLPVCYQGALALHYLEGLSVDEVAAVLNVAPGTVKSRLARGRDLLRERLRGSP